MTGKAAEAVSAYLTQLVNTWDPEREAEAKSVAAFIQGRIAGGFMQKDQIVKVKAVEMPQEDGQYLNYMVVVTEAGHRIRVTVEAEIEPKI